MTGILLYYIAQPFHRDHPILSVIGNNGLISLDTPNVHRSYLISLAKRSRGNDRLTIRIRGNIRSNIIGNVSFNLIVYFLAYTILQTGYPEIISVEILG